MIIQALNLMWKGMLSIFIAIGIVYITVLLLHYFSQRKAKNKAETAQDSENK